MRRHRKFNEIFVTQIKAYDKRANSEVRMEMFKYFYDVNVSLFSQYLKKVAWHR